jgi:DNA-binding NarL/FixJ family response regulator
MTLTLALVDDHHVFREGLRAVLSTQPDLCVVGEAEDARRAFSVIDDKKPNIVLIVADDLGCFELGCYGQTKIKTPSIDKLAAGGAKLTHFYSGSPVCAPSRCVLMTGKHTGHTTVRTNVQFKKGEEGQFPIRAEDVTIDDE